MPKAYIIAEITVSDADAYRTSGYMAMAEAAIAAQGGRYLVRGGTASALEGEPEPGRVVVLEFPSRAAAEAFYHGTEYGPALRLRQSLSTGRFVLVDGVETTA